MTEQTADQRIYQLGHALGRLEGNVEQLALALQREHDERIAAMKAHELRADATDRRVEEILDRLAQQIGRLGQEVAADRSAITSLQSRRNDSISASRWFAGIVITLAVSGASMYGSFRGAESAPCAQRQPAAIRSAD